MLRLVDAHCHLQDAAFATDLAEVIQRASAGGVCRLVANGTGESDWSRLLELSRRFPQIVPCFGLHPWFVGARTERWESELERHLDAVPGAVGEIGLDRWVEPRDERQQESVFRAQLAIARRRRRPAMIHCLRAWGWLMDVLESEDALPAGMLIHAYGGPEELIEPLADKGAYFSFAGNVFESRRGAARKALAATPLDRLLLETDSPDMPPPWIGKQRNEPANLPRILREAALIRGMNEGDLAAALMDNARRLLGDLLRDA
jgi:TatD DNase family protein